MTESKAEERKKKRAEKQDLTKGNPFSALIGFSVPMLLSMLFQQLYNIVDSVVAGQFIGKNALAAVGASFPVTMLFIAIASGCSIGSGVIVSQLFGLRESKRLKSAIFTALISIFVLSAALTLIGLFVCNPLLSLLKTPETIFADSSAYLSIYIWGLVFLFIYNAANSIFTGLGDSKTPLFLLIFSSLFNIVLDVLFVTAFDMGVAGVAWATFIAQGLAGVIALICLLIKVKGIKTEGRVKPFDAALLKNITIVAVPSIFQQSFISVGQLCVQSLINGFGDDVIGGYSAAMKVSVMAVSCYNTMSSALSSFTGQNIGASQPKRVKAGFKCSLYIGAGLVALFVILFWTAGKYLIGLFVSGEETAGVIDAGRTFLQIVSLGYPFVMLKVSCDGVLRGSGDMTAFMISTFSDLVVRVVISFALAPSLGFAGICLSYPIGWIVGMAVSLCFYIRGKWKDKIKV